MNRFFQVVRKLARFVAAVLLWLHAIFLLHFPKPPLSRWAATSHLEPAEAEIILALLLLTALSSYGLPKFAVDLLYIYFFPFILLYYLGRVLVIPFVAVYKSLYREQAALGLVAVPPPVAASPAAPPTGAPTPAPETGWWKGSLSTLSRPFRQFVLLWCLLLLLSSSKYLIWVAFVVVLFRLSRALIMAFSGVVFSMKWLASIENEIQTRLEVLLSRLMEIPEDIEISTDGRNLVVQVASTKALLRWLENRRQVSFVLMVLSIAAFVAFHLYFAFLFSFTYYGLARLQSLPFTWAESLVTSVFIPFEIGNLPRNVWLELVGGIHCTLGVALGFGTLLAFIQKKLEGVYRATRSVNARLDSIEIKGKLERLSDRIAKPQQPGSRTG